MSYTLFFSLTKCGWTEKKKRKKLLPFPCNYYCSNTICKLLSWCCNCLTSSNHAAVIYNSTRCCWGSLIITNAPELEMSSALAHFHSALSHSVTLSLQHFLWLSVFLSPKSDKCRVKISYIWFCRAEESSLADTLGHENLNRKGKLSYVQISFSWKVSIFPRNSTNSKSLSLGHTAFTFNAVLMVRKLELIIAVLRWKLYSQCLQKKKKKLDFLCPFHYLDLNLFVYSLLGFTSGHINWLVLPQ